MECFTLYQIFKLKDMSNVYYVEYCRPMGILPVNYALDCGSLLSYRNSVHHITLLRALFSLTGSRV